MTWVDERYMSENEHRITECESNHVLWTENSQFWLPMLWLNDAQEQVINHLVFE